jgi:ADP-sugar diphosphatase
MEKLEEAHKYQLWRKSLLKSGLKINKIDSHFTRMHNGQVLFSLLMLDAETPEGDKMPPICFLKGEVVSILVCLIDEATNEKYLILVKQRRIAEGNFTYEHPAGMVDGNTQPIDIAVQEVREETGIEVAANQLITLTNKRLFPSTGTSDEAMYFFGCELRLPIEKIRELDNKHMGLAHEHERITTHVVPFLEAHKLINNSNGILLNYLYLSQVGDFELLKQLHL